jgi:hypothetical protein
LWFWLVLLFRQAPVPVITIIITTTVIARFELIPEKARPCAESFLRVKGFAGGGSYGTAKAVP